MKLDTEWFEVLKGIDNASLGEVVANLVWQQPITSPAARIALNMLESFMDKSVSVRKKPASEKAVAKAAEREERKQQLEETVDYIYSLYPGQCPISKRPLGKCAKDKVRIRALLKDWEPDVLAATIESYIIDCESNNRYMKNFSTLLNNLPDPEGVNDTGKKTTNKTKEDRQWQ